jgi:formylglycine-generating enzyme required for sulfatase activity
MSHEDREHSPASESDVSALARDLYLEFLSSELAGEAPDFEALCRARPELAGELRLLRRGDTTSTRDSMIEIAPDARGTEHEAHAPGLVQLLRRLGRPTLRAERYRRGPELGRGSMGRVFSAWDRELARVLALKVLHGIPEGASRPAPTDRVLRFIREAQITSQLDHPGIVPVHELGIDENGNPFFAMKLVRGRDLKSVFDSTWAGEDGWNLTRAVGVLHRICEAMGYAHAKGIVHRDLKPTNIMVGRFGEVFVMDWGVAHVEPRSESSEDPETTALIHAARRPLQDDALLTEEGSILGTAAYMSPEQASGDVRKLGAWTDVYAIGTLLYQLLAKQPPYIRESPSGSTVEVLERLRAGPPEPLARAAPDAPPELVSICERAMAREPQARYRGMQALAEDLQAYLEGRVVRAHHTGVRAEIKKWILRNRATSAVLALGILLASAASIGWSLWRTDRAQLDLLQTLREPSALLEQFDHIWPATEDHIAGIRAWIGAADRVVESGKTYRAQLASLRERALPYDPGAPEELRARAHNQFRLAMGKKTLAYYERECERMRRVGGKTFDGFDLPGAEQEIVLFQGLIRSVEAEIFGTKRQSWTFSTADDDLLHDRLSRIDHELDELAGTAVPRPRLEIAKRVVAAFEHAGNRSATATDALWEEAIRCVGDPTRCPMYAGLHLRRQEQLVPLGPDPQSGLWEFAHALTGEIPARGSDGHLQVDEFTAIVLVLVPPGSFHRGAQSIDQDLPNYDPFSQRIESPVLGMPMDAFFLSKFELTLAQWERLTSRDKASELGVERGDRMKPATNMTWEDGIAVLRCVGLDLPSEAQWEFAARAGTSAPWWTGPDESALPAAANLREPGPLPSFELSIEDLRSAGPDGWPGFAPIGRLLPNPFGLYDILGNAEELTRDIGLSEYSYRNIFVGTGECLRNINLLRRARGGSCNSDPRDARCSSRHFMSRDETEYVVGLRPSLDFEQ